jgi:hypothetical protein
VKVTGNDIPFMFSANAVARAVNVSWLLIVIFPLRFLLAHQESALDECPIY